MKRLFAAALAALALSACNPGEEPPPPPPAAGGGGGGASSQGGGGGDVQFGAANTNREGAPAATRNPQIEQKYDRAVKKIKDNDFDGAYLELGSLLSEAPDTNVATRAMKDLETVQNQLLAIPPTPASQMLSKPKKFSGKPLSVRGTFLAVDAAAGPDTFWLNADGKRVQCRYPRLHPEAKRAISTMPAGSKLLVRGFWKAGETPFLDVTLFKIES